MRQFPIKVPDKSRDMRKLIELLSGYGRLSGPEIQCIKASSELLTLKGGDYFIPPENAADSIIFIAMGIMRVCSSGIGGKESTLFFIEEHHFIIDTDKYRFPDYRNERIQALTDTQLIILNATRAKPPTSNQDIWDKIIDRLTIDALSDKIRRISPMLAVNATERYKILLETYPGLILNIPLFYIASYLGVTRQSLSRIRKSVCENQVHSRAPSTLQG